MSGMTPGAAAALAAQLCKRDAAIYWHRAAEDREGNRGQRGADIIAQGRLFCPYATYYLFIVKGKAFS